MVKPNRLLGVALLALTLLAGQVVMVCHQASHHAGYPNTTCAQCLVAVPLGGGPVAAGWPLILSADPVLAVAFLAVGVFCTAPRAARARAPPLSV